MKTAFIALRAVAVMSLFLGLWAWVALGLRGYDARYGLHLRPDAQGAGYLVAAAGAVIVILCVGAFVIHGRGTPAPFDAPRIFVARGLYRYVRNPMYIGGALLLAGLGLWLRSGAVLMFCLPWLLLAHLFVVIYEEPTLRAKFGATYEQYCRSVPRWVPRVPSNPKSAAAVGGGK